MVKRSFVIALSFAIICVTASILAPNNAQASAIGHSRNLGLGMIFGSPTGFDLKYFTTPTSALEGALGLGFFGGHGMNFHLDYKITLATILRAPELELPFYLGIGGKMLVWFDDHDHHYWGSDDYNSHLGLGVRVPFGAAFQFNAIPVDIFVELAPGIAFLPGIGGFLDGGLGVRYFF